MPDSFLLTRILLKFDSSLDDLLTQLSAIARTPDGSLWVGSDELVTIERLTPTSSNVYGAHQSYRVNDFVNLMDPDDEIDIEGLDYSDGYLWVVGSHSFKRNKPKGKKPEKDIERLSDIKVDRNRYLLARIPVMQGDLVRSCARPGGDGSADQVLTAAMLEQSSGQNVLMDALEQDEHLGPFIQMRLPSKDNGLDIEGLAVAGNQVFLGLRGPVLRGWAMILELEIGETGPGILSLKETQDGAFYKKHFVDLNGLGVREICLHGEDLIILAGPTMALEGAMQVFRLEKVLAHSQDTLWDQESGMLSVLFDLPFTIGSDHAEGLALFPCVEEETGLLVVYDEPDPMRLHDDRSVFADVFRLPYLR